MENTDIPNRGRKQFQKFKKIIILLAKFYCLFPLCIRIKLLEFHRYTKGKIGIGIRYALIKSIATKCGDNVAIFEGVFLNNPENLILGKNISIHPMTYIDCGYVVGGVTIDNDVSIAHGATLMATNHKYSGHTGNIRDFKVSTETIHICNDVWIAAKATITAGNTIASGCVIGANAVVTKNTETNGIYVGVPAKQIKNRNEEHIENES